MRRALLALLFGCGRVAFEPLDGPRPDARAPLPGGMLALGGNHTCLLRDGAVRCWGRGVEGQLGYGNTASLGDDDLPGGLVDVGGFVVEISAGDAYTCARLDTGAVRCWGNNSQGQLGYGNLALIGDDELPASAGDLDLGGRAIQVSATTLHACALLEDHTLRCWGDGRLGRLGYGNELDIGDDETPASAGPVPVGGPVTQVVVGSDHTCALLETGGVRCWGDGGGGRLGYGNTVVIGDDEPAGGGGDVDVGPGTVVELGADTLGARTCVRFDTGSVRCWGGGVLGYANNLSIGDDEVPAVAGDIDLGGSAIQIAVGGDHQCAVLAGGGLRCWGASGAGQLGYGNTTTIGDDETPASVGDVPVGGPVESIAADRRHTCAILVGGAVRCWGLAAEGQLGYGNTATIGDDEPASTAGDVPL